MHPTYGANENFGPDVSSFYSSGNHSDYTLYNLTYDEPEECDVTVEVDDYTIEFFMETGRKNRFGEPIKMYKSTRIMFEEVYRCDCREFDRIVKKWNSPTPKGGNTEYMMPHREAQQNKKMKKEQKY